VHSAQRRGKTFESGREQGNKSRERIKGDRGKNIKRGAREVNRKSQVEGEVASMGNSKSKRGRKVIGTITSPRVGYWASVLKSFSEDGNSILLFASTLWLLDWIQLHSKIAMMGVGHEWS